MTGRPDPVLLEPALDAARRALRALDEEEVPARLRRVAASSARRLPRPFAESLLAALDEDEWLRGAALDAWEEADPHDPDPRRAASALFLRRPAGWREAVAGVAAARDRDESAARVAEAEAHAGRLEARIRDLEAELAAAATAVERTEVRVRGERRAELDRTAAVAADLRRRLADAERDLAAARFRAERLETDLSEADARIGVLRDRLLRERRQEETTSPSGAPFGFGRGDPMSAARLLDQLVEALRPAGGEPGEAASPSGGLALPSGIRPDRGEAIGWVLRAGVPLTLVVDGYNVAHAVDPRPGPAARSRVVHALERIRRLADAPVRVLVFWDSADEPDARESGGVRIRFVPDADAAVVAEAERIDGPVVVVSGDRAVRERSEASGAVGLWSSALLEWMG